MPEVIDGDVGGQSFAVGPSEIAMMPGDIDSLRFRARGSSKPWTDLDLPNNSERRLSAGFGHCGSQVLGDCSAVAHISQHHGILHRPRIVAIHKSDEPVIAIRAPGRMARINRLALDKEGVMRGNYGTRFCARISELE